MADTESKTNGPAFLQVPTWDQILRLIQNVGVVSLIAAALLWFLLKTVDNRFVAQELATKELTAALNEQRRESMTSSLAQTKAILTMNDILAQHDMTGQLILWVLQTTCVNEALDDEARRLCLSRPEHGR